ncbi:MAG TPA: beta-galactosidase trimerization domain-containing protein [Coriobacteriia bacterium]|nr:beta-galactosidase trimerization domain-containing protein [Coriobacteriia bacterium]
MPSDREIDGGEGQTDASPMTPEAVNAETSDEELRTSGAAVPADAARRPRRNPLFGTGVSLYPLDDEADEPEDWYSRDVTADLDTLTEAKCSLVRLFVGWRVLEPQVGQYDAEILGRLSELVKSVDERGMQSIVCFFADDRHADLASVPWGARRDPRIDPYLLQREAAVIAQVVSALHGSAGLFAWQLGDEAFLSGFTTAEDLAAWAGQLREAIREHDPARPIGLGADVETFFRSSGIDMRALAESFEFSVAHATSAYRAYASQGPLTSVNSSYLEPFLLRCAPAGKPVLLDETGPLSLEYSAGEEAQALRVALWSAICNGASGVMARRLRDMRTERREPYFLDPFETLVGVLDDEGEAKPAFDELATFIATSAVLDLRAYTPLPERAAVLMPAERYEPLPSLAGLYAPRACLQAFVTAKRAQVPVKVVHEGEELREYRLIAVPSAFRLEDGTWSQLAEFVQAGGTVLYSYGGGELAKESAGLFGVEFVGDGGPRRSFECRVAQQRLLGDLENFDSLLELPAYALVTPSTATVVATDATGNPLLTVNQVGQGRAVFVSVPLERAVAQGDPWAAPHPVLALLRELYGSSARAAGCAAPFECDTPEVEVTLFSGDTDDVIVLINHSPERVLAGMSTNHPVASISDIRGGAEVPVGGKAFGVPLGAGGVSALRLTYE